MSGTIRGCALRRAALAASVVAILVGLAGLTISATTSGSGVVVVPIEGVVDLGMASFVERSVAEAHETGADALLLDINTLGGRVDAAILIRDALVESEIPTVAFIHPRAISAGAFISLACKTIAIVDGGSIGAATPVTGAGDGEMKAADEKVVSYWRTEMRTTAERNGRRGDIAEAMVDRDVAIEDIVEEGKLLTLTSAEALRLGIADFQATSVEDLLEQLDLQGAVIDTQSVNWAERIARIVSNPVISSLLMSIGFLGILIELYQPGWGIPGTIGISCLLLFFLGHYVVRLAGWEELLLFGIGLGLLALEIFVIPGVGVAGIAGVSLILVSLFLALIGRDLSISWHFGYMTDALTVLAGAVLGIVAGGALAIRLLPRSRAGGFLILKRSLETQEGYTTHSASPAREHPPGTDGLAISDLRPAGVIRVGDDRIDALSEGGFIGRGTRVEIVSWRAGQPVVRPIEAPEKGTEDAT